MQEELFDLPEPRAQAPGPGAGTDPAQVPPADRASRFLDELASARPTPGGGGAAALMGAMAAALVTMAARLTLDKPGYEAAQDEVRRLLSESEALRHRATALVDEDAAAVRRLLAATRLPRSTPPEAAARDDALQAAWLAATQSPLACARACGLALRLAGRAAGCCNRHARADVAVGAHAAWAGLCGAALTATVNLPRIRDRGVADALQAELASLQSGGEPLLQQVRQQALRTD